MADTQNMKARLQNEKAELEVELEKIGRRNPQNAKDWEAESPEAEDVEADTNEAADRIEELEQRSAVLNELEARLQSVNAALDRIEKGTYGVCEVSGEPIEEERLEANPAATTCTKHM